MDLKNLFSGTKSLVGLDIGSTSTKLAEIVATSQGSTLNRFFQVPMPPGVIVEGILQDPGALSGVIKELFRHSGCKGKGIVTSLSGNSVIIKKVTLAQMEETELRELIHDEAGKYLPFDNMDDVNYDFQILGDNEFNPNQMDVIIVAAKKTDVNGYLDAFAAAGLTVMIMDVDSFALETMYEANYDFEENEIIVIVNIGASLTNINVIKGGMSVFTRDFTMAGNAITEALQERFQVTAEEAERMKVEGTAGDKEIPDLENVILDAAEPICSEIERSVDYFRSTFGGDEIKQVLLSGGSSRIAGLSDLLSQRLNIGTQLVNPLAKIGYNKKNIDEGKLDSIRTIGAVAIGLGLRKIGDK
ncbi:MAG: type IV pilus assembly protein PilM [Smithellaceae bacterium]|jgi:type IV pilus assembly protein PilM|nr:type IV pilus assembly protein PilM [Smithellaceae bacterium]MDD3259762.1 type IV pilus assembly protein PilM [Smithellaceae bacterium]MDD3849304.1 type IV pilus assembly protein PilM [Smithellaceae bacterium]HOG12482.1 type IV pilus assembly protein PilM [Smithellaceae bacterium]HOQ71939.1 type IV pilus assembly protein PilM [Smithellaceae bacterium]